MFFWDFPLESQQVGHFDSMTSKPLLTHIYRKTKHSLNSIHLNPVNLGFILLISYEQEILYTQKILNLLEWQANIRLGDNYRRNSSKMKSMIFRF